MQKNSKIDELERDLREGLTFGPWKIGEKLPPEEHFMARFGVSRSMLREAMKTLSAEGVIVRRHGSGTYLQYIPQKRVELFVRLDNIISPAGNWYRWQVEHVKKTCRSMDFDLEVLVSYGDTPGEEAASFQRHLSRPTTSELIGSLVFFYSPELEASLAWRGGRFVTMTPIGGTAFRGSSVVLDYRAMGQAMAAEVHHLAAVNPMIVYVDDPAEKIGREAYGEMQHLYNMVVPDRRHHLALPSLEAVESGFAQWLAAHGADCDLLVSTDDEITKITMGVLKRSGRSFPRLRCITHGNHGLFAVEDLPIPVSLVIGFEPERVARAAWNLLMEPGDTRQIKIAPSRIQEEV